MNARTIDELGAMAAARRQLEMLTPDQRTEVLRDAPEVSELIAAARLAVNVNRVTDGLRIAMARIDLGGAT